MMISTLKKYINSTFEIVSVYLYPLDLGSKMNILGEECCSSKFRDYSLIK